MEHPGRSLRSQLALDDRARLDSLPYVDQEVTIGTVTKLIRFYPIGTYAEMLNRKVKTIYYWEEHGIIPVTPFRYSVSDRAETANSPQAERRLYTEGMVLGSVRIAREEGVLEKYNFQLRRTKFPRRVAALFEAEERALSAQFAA
jgi:hypothetical protein